MKTRIILAGGSGFLGTELAQYFAAREHEVVILTRSPRSDTGKVREVAWDGATLGDWARELEGARAVINLAGVSVNCRYHARNRALILNSRVNSTRVVAAYPLQGRYRVRQRSPRDLRRLARLDPKQLRVASR